MAVGVRRNGRKAVFAPALAPDGGGGRGGAEFPTLSASLVPRVVLVGVFLQDHMPFYLIFPPFPWLLGRHTGGRGLPGRAERCPLDVPLPPPAPRSPGLRPEGPLLSLVGLASAF